MTHDAAPGPLTHCQITGSTDLFEIIDLGHQPLCDSLPASRDEPETTYPLRLMMCPASGLAQLSYVVPGDVVYHPGYPYRSGISAPLRDYQRAFAAGVVEELGLRPESYVVDIGSNDGTLLSGFKERGMDVLGFEPTNIAFIAQQSGIPTTQNRFTAPIANVVRAEDGPAHLITATNVFAHMADLGEVMRGIDALLAPDGVFITESHYLLDVLEKNQFDTVYHEHIRTYSLKSLCVLFDQYGMEVFDVRRADRYGGNIRAYVARRGCRTVGPVVAELLAAEVDAGLFRPDTWAAWRERVNVQRTRMQDFLDLCAYYGQTVAGKSCPGRASTLINYFGITRDQVPYLAELPDSLKLGRYLPGAHIPIVDESRLFDEQPDYLVLFSWHYADAIMSRMRERGYRGKFVMPLPEFKVVG